jgi:hypothetical protein
MSSVLLGRLAALCSWCPFQTGLIQDKTQRYERTYIYRNGLQDKFKGVTGTVKLNFCSVVDSTKLNSAQSVTFWSHCWHRRVNFKNLKCSFYLYYRVGCVMDKIFDTARVSKTSWDCPFKGSVQRKLRWVKNSTNRWILVLDYGGGDYFFVLFDLHLGFIIFPFPVSTAQVKGEFSNNKRSGANSQRQ